MNCESCERECRQKRGMTALHAAFSAAPAYKEALNSLAAGGGAVRSAPASVFGAGNSRRLHLSTMQRERGGRILLHMPLLLLTSVLPCAIGCCKAQFINEQNISRSLEVGRHLGKLDAINENLRVAVSHVPSFLRSGLYMEFGVRDGLSISFLANLTVGVQWHGFDSFFGLPDAGHTPRSSGNRGWVPFTFSRHGVLPEVPQNVRLHAGWFNESVPRFLDTDPAAINSHVAFMNMDADLFVSTWSVFEAVFERCLHRAGTVISFDELFGTKPILREEFRALKEAQQRFHFSYHFISYALVPGSPFARSAIQLDDCGDQCRHNCFRPGYEKPKRSQERLRPRIESQEETHG